MTTQQISLGTLAWGAATGGRISTREKLKMTLDGARAILASKFSAPLLPEPAEWDVPKSKLATFADTLLRETSPDWLTNHGYRTYAWAGAFAQRDNLRPDRELLFCAALLHDLGITPQYLPQAGGCFALSGATAALDALRAEGMEAPRAKIVAEAIALHLNVVVALTEHGPEAHLLRAATACDVAGQGAEHLPKIFREKTLQEIPRLNFKDEVSGVMLNQAKQNPETRIGFLCNRLGLVARVKAAPFAS
jgi:hypothetical protein